MVEKIIKIRNAVKDAAPLIHCITATVSINQCANAVLSTGARPITAEHPKEVGEITRAAQALMLNLGNLTPSKQKAMEISARAAKKNNVPVIFDAVGVACSGFRRKLSHKIIRKYQPKVIKGNYSEIYSLHDDAYKSSGVDADKHLDKEKLADISVFLAKKYNAIILASGKCDIISDGRKLIYIENGTPQLSSITGTGCILGAITASFLSVSPDINAVAAACAVLGISGELSRTKMGMGTFFMNLMDTLSVLTDDEIKENLKTEVKKIEKV